MLAGFAPSEDHDADATVSAAREDPSPSVRAYAVAAAARRGRRTVTARVRDLHDDAPEVRRRACQLEARSPRRSVKVLAALEGLLGDADAWVVVAAAEALGEAGDASAVAPLGAVANDHGDARCREAAIAALGAIGDDAGLGFVLAGLEDKPAVRRRAVVSLAAFRGPDVEAALARAQDDRDWQVREVAQALLDAGDGAD